MVLQSPPRAPRPGSAPPGVAPHPAPTTARGGTGRHLAERAWHGVDGTSLAVVRIAFGAVTLFAVARTVAYGWVDTLYVGPPNHFTYAGFGWVAPPSRTGAYVLLTGMAVASVAIALGWRTRLAIVAFLVGFTWFELIEVTTYLNHYWFVTLLGVLLVAVPADAAWSLDARRRDGPTRVTVPLGAVWLLRAQVGVVYVFAGIAKLNADWLLHGMPLRIWLPTHADLPVVGPLLDEAWFALGASWAGAAFDLLVVPALCWKRTRPFAWLAIVVFHVVTWRLFPIGVFPWLMIATSTIFFAPDWPRRCLTRARTRPRPAAAVGADRAVPARRSQATTAARTPWARSAIAVVGVAWITVQVALPLRHWLVPGDASWTNEGYRFAWVVLLTEKGGDASFRVTDRRTGEHWRETARDLYRPSQWRMMATEPELVRQAAHTIADRATSRGRDVEVRADVFVSWNGRPAARLVDPSVDLAREPWRLHQDWILPAPRSAPP